MIRLLKTCVCVELGPKLLTLIMRVAVSIIQSIVEEEEGAGEYDDGEEEIHFIH